ncbi:hypothetical protein MES4922_110020 [Mesorhizobium ventifaucium]|uniref:Winged helix-turn helix domain-containing protein n=1 Tax=Mesorhizobium ventifaucium TaxID=666020 RepID=A0ABN8J9P0_9HYPH|nr:hypothetical protein MES4922_110020 [Mesorhizobium ventifaucium]
MGRRPGCRHRRRPNWRRSWRPAPIRWPTASCAGGASISRRRSRRFGVDYHERYVSTLLKELGFSHMSARPRHPAQDGAIVEAYKKTSRAR